MSICSTLLNNPKVTEEAKSHLLRSTDRRIAPAVTMLYKRASQDVAQPMRLSALYLLPLPPALPQPFTQQNKSQLTESSFLYKLTDRYKHTHTEARSKTNMDVTLSLGLVKVDMLCICVG